MTFSSPILACLCTCLILALAPFPAAAQSAVDCQDNLDCESSWLNITAAERQQVFAFAEQYKAFIHRARTELTFVTEAIAFAETNGFRRWSEQSVPTPGPASMKSTGTGPSPCSSSVAARCATAFISSVPISIPRVWN